MCCVFDGAAALPAVESLAPDAIVLDIMLPGMDGEQVLYQLRRGGNKVPVIMLTARARALETARLLESGGSIDQVDRTELITDGISPWFSAMGRGTSWTRPAPCCRRCIP